MAMPQQGFEASLLSCFRAMFERAMGEVAQPLGAAVDVEVTFLGQMAPGEWPGRLGGPALLVSGAVRGQVEGPVLFVLEGADAIRLAANASGAGKDELAERLKQPLGEADAAAMAFLLARVGAAGTAAWEAKVRWPSEATEWQTSLTTPESGGILFPSPLAEAATLAGVGVRLAGPLASSLVVLVPGDLAEGLARLGEGVGSDSAPSRPGPLALARLLPVTVPVRVVVGRRGATLRQLLTLAPGRVLDLGKPCEAPLELFAASKLVARGDTVVADNKLCFRVGELVWGGRASCTGSADPSTRA